MSISAIILAAALAPAGAPPIEIPDGCRLTHYRTDGTRIDRPASPDERRPGGGEARAFSHSSGKGGASSSVAVSASSSSAGSSRAKASAQTDGGGRSITTTEDDSGCRIVVDDRAAGDRR